MITIGEIPLGLEDRPPPYRVEVYTHNPKGKWLDLELTQTIVFYTEDSAEREIENLLNNPKVIRVIWHKPLEHTRIFYGNDPKPKILGNPRNA